MEQDRIIAGKYRLIRRISGGGMGSVWLAHHEQLDAPVAVKFMHGSLLDVAGARARFEREAKSAAQIRSPHVVHVYDHGIDEDESPFIVMEYLEGEDLGRRLKRVRPMPLDEAARICDQICKGLYRAHRLGIVHRDLKPGNIYLSAEDDDMVKILDFGIAKETGQRRVVKGETTTTGQVLGSPHYMSPEQARGQPLDGRSDLWSVAVILFRAITGRRPFDGDDVGDLIVRICTDPIPTASRLRPELGPVVDKFFERAFCRDPDGRFQTAKALAAEFRAAVLGPRVAFGEIGQDPVLVAGQTAAADASHSAPSGESWRTKDSGSFSSSVRAGVGDDEALTQATPSYPSREDDEPPTGTPIDASHTLGAFGAVVVRRRRRMRLIATSAIVGTIAVAAIAAWSLAPGPRDVDLAGQSNAPAPVAVPSSGSSSDSTSAGHSTGDDIVSGGATPSASSSSAAVAASEEPTPEASTAPSRQPSRATRTTRPPPPRRTPPPARKKSPDLGY